MKALYQGYINTNAVPVLPGSTSLDNILLLGGLAERDAVAHLQKVVHEFYPQAFGCKALDLSSGRGVAAMALAEMGFRVAAYDVYRSSISVVQKLALAQELDIAFGVNGVTQLEELREKFDLIHDRDCLSSIIDRQERMQFLNSVRNSLAPGGKFVLTTDVWTENYDPEDSFESVRLDNNYVLWRQTPECDIPGVKAMEGKFWTAQKRIAPPEEIRLEVMSRGFKILMNKLEIPAGNGPARLKLVLTSAFAR
ncbi:hypothetical protein AZI87_01795 [Bdellovibrio bacteriovorus]|uniref:Methyltransferase domain-containing protein n=1 Tax=Bdellovibrio bacteriovorus TaxID=959 RepID=A0A162GFL2_BDEBC|nr:class I SAM-dependent methyltransferase [Bdellovibrio bacteriovorus]KYG68027.1 hypothetical protein AZI87_01795 [Bdellovibrio bacteriovorus]